MIGFLFFIVVIGLLVVVLTGGLQRLGTRSGRPDAVGSQADVDSIRMADLVTSLEARIDRLEDQQRFLERLLEERPSAGSLPPPPSEEGDDDQRGGSPLFDVGPGER